MTRAEYFAKKRALWLERLAAVGLRVCPNPRCMVVIPADRARCYGCQRP